MSVEEISPEKAKKYLGDNYEYNRNIRAHVVKRYANDIVNGKWRWQVAPPIIFDGQGRVIDGQHRLAAVVRSGRTVESYVIRGADEEDYKVIDSGIPRKAGDLLRDMPNSSHLGAVARIMLNWDAGNRHGCFLRGGGHGGTIWTNRDVRDYVLSHPDIHTYVRKGMDAYRKIGVPVRVFALFARNAYEADQVAAESFLAQVESGVLLEPGSPAEVVRTQIVSESVKGRKGGGYIYPSEAVYSWLVKGFNDFLAGKSHRRYTHPETEEVPDIKVPKVRSRRSRGRKSQEG